MRMENETISEEQLLHNKLNFEINQELIHLMKRIVELQQENTQLKEQRQELRSWLEDEINICDGVISTRTSDFQELGGRSAGKTFIQNEIFKNKVALKSFELALNKLNELENKNA